jgi:hypothetical protein
MEILFFRRTLMKCFTLIKQRYFGGLSIHFREVTRMVFILFELLKI